LTGLLASAALFRRWLVAADWLAAVVRIGCAPMDPAPPIRVNRAPVLTLWATVVAERIGYAAGYGWQEQALGTTRVEME
jgi:hypothetical protein